MLPDEALNERQQRRIVLEFAFAQWITALFYNVKFRRSFCREKGDFSMKAVLF